MKKNNLLTVGLVLLFGAMAVPTSAQVVSNDNEDGVNKVDSRVRGKDFVPGQVLVKFKDETNIQVHRNAQGKFHAASIGTIDKLLRHYRVNDMEKLFPAEVAKPKAKLRKKVAPNGTIVQERNLDKVFWVKLNTQSPDSTLQLIEKLKSLHEVEYAEPNYRAYITADVPTGDMPYVRSAPQPHLIAPALETEATAICSTPSQNPLYFRQYGITQQNINYLWDKPIINKKRPIIAILDTGVDINHPDLVANIWTNTAEAEGETAYDDDGNEIVDDVHGWNFVENYYDLTDRNGHGTHCAGIAAAVDNGIGIVGANPLALIMPVKVMSDKGIGDDATIARGIVYAAENGADVLSMSFGSTMLSNTMKNALDFAYQTAILVASAGNCGYDIYKPFGTNYPAAYYLVLGVEATGSDLGLASFSNYDPDGPIYSEDGIDGRNYEVQVPGVSIYSTLPNGQYNTLSGTSMSTPLFAGAVSALQMVKDYPSKDVLYGDLIHLKADFAKIYSDDTPRMPKIDLVSLSVDDNVEGNNNIDGQVDVGETILFTPLLRNTWADATDIQLHLTVDPVYASFVEIENPLVPFGQSLSAYGRAEAATPIKVTFANNIGDATRIKFILEVSYHESAESFTQDVYVTVNNMVKISGLVTENRTLTADHVYYVNKNLAIPEGVTLTIEPGTRLEFAGGVGLSSNGKLVANGTPAKPIIFTGHKGADWGSISSHEGRGIHFYSQQYVYTNSESTQFTVIATEQTPNIIYDLDIGYYYKKPGEDIPVFRLNDYVSNPDMTNMDLLSDPNYLTPIINRIIADAENYYSPIATDDKTEEFHLSISLGITWSTYDDPRDLISYCRVEGFEPGGGLYPYMNDCFISPNRTSSYNGVLNSVQGVRNTITNICDVSTSYSYQLSNALSYSNIVNNYLGGDMYDYAISWLPHYGQLAYNNYFNNYMVYIPWNNYHGRLYSLGFDTTTPEIDRSDFPSYLGTSREDIIRPFIWEIGNGQTFGHVDLSSMPTRPYSEAHGIVWKVVVNGKDAQDEFEDLAPLGVGRHKFEVYFNRPMNKAVAPQITFGVREPYTQQSVNEDGSWNEEGTIYTAYKTISGRTSSDGLNRIYVQGAEDNEFFPCPYEKTRFNINIQAAGSMATGFMAEAGLGKVELTWNNDENDFDDAMGFNVYRYNPEEKRTIPAHYDDNGNYIGETEVVDTICLNKEIIDIEATEYIDYDVTPGQTYYYYYKVLSTDLQEYDVSNVVTATPQAGELGDANGDTFVDVADVITTVNFAAGMEPKPFIFEAADMNADLMIDILDVIGIIQKILNPNATAPAMVENVATYTIEDGVLYVESPVDLAGVQVQLNLPQHLQEEGSFSVAEDLDGFEHTSAWLSEQDYLFLAYNMNGKTLSAGKHALLHIGDAQIASIRLSNTMGGSVPVEEGSTTGIEQVITGAETIMGIYNLHGQRVAVRADQLNMLPKGVYIVDGKKVIKWK